MRSYLGKLIRWFSCGGRRLSRVRMAFTLGWGISITLVQSGFGAEVVSVTAMQGAVV